MYSSGLTGTSRCWKTFQGGKNGNKLHVHGRLKYVPLLAAFPPKNLFQILLETDADWREGQVDKD